MDASHCRGHINPIWRLCPIFIVTQRRKAEQATKRALAELNQIFETAADGMRVIDENFNVLRTNHTLLMLSGVSDREAAGKKCYEVFPGPMCHTPACPLTRILNGAERIKFDVEKERNGGVIVPCKVTATPPFSGLTEKSLGLLRPSGTSVSGNKRKWR